jgi:hypothetical protein
MPKVAEKVHTQTLERPEAKKHSVLFHEQSSDKDPLFKGLYLMRDAAKKLLDVENLDEVKGIKITVEVIR